MTDLVRIPGVSAMKDETLMLHLELRHGNDLRMEFNVEPGRTERRLHASTEWRTFHDAVHRIHPGEYDHVHNEES